MATADDVQALLDRLETLETRSAFQDQTIEDLNAMVVEQWSRIDQALRRVGEMEERLRDLQERTPVEPQDEPPPPHY